MIKNKGKGNIESRDDWETPQWLFDTLHKQYNFTYDCCASDNNSKCDVWSDDDFLDYNEAFKHDIHWMNPPFSKATEMFRHYFKVVGKGVCIYRCDNMETKLWQDVILQNATWIFIPKGRINYEGKVGSGSVFCSAIIGYNVNPPQSLNGRVLFIR